MVGLKRIQIGLVFLLLVWINLVTFMFGTSTQHAESYDIVLMIVILLVGILLFSTSLSGNVHTSTVPILLVSLIITMIVTTQVMKYTDFSLMRVWHTYYTIRAAQSIASFGRIDLLSAIFNNFGSAPAGPLILGILEVVSGLGSLPGLTVYGLTVFGAAFVPLLYLVVRLFGKVNHAVLLIAAIIPIMKLQFQPPFFLYNFVNWGLLLLLLYLFLIPFFRGSRVDRRFLALTFALTALASLVYYPPGTIVFCAILLGLTAGIRVFGRGSSAAFVALRYTILLIVLTAAYVVYCGYFFYNDIMAYLGFLVNSFRAEPYVVYGPQSFPQLDMIQKVVVETTRLANLAPLLYLLGFVWGVRKGGVVRAVSIVGIVMIGSAYGGGVFLHSISDYGYRLYLYSAPFATLILYWAIERGYSLSGKRKMLCVGLVGIVLISSLFIVVQTSLTPQTPAWASEGAYLMEDSYSSSSFAAHHLTSSEGPIYANGRYGYVKSLWAQENYEELTDHSIGYFMSSQNGVLILCPLVFSRPDNPEVGTLTTDEHNLLLNKANLVFNSNATWIFINP